MKLTIKNCIYGIAVLSTVSLYMLYGAAAPKPAQVMINLKQSLRRQELMLPRWKKKLGKEVPDVFEVKKEVIEGIQQVLEALKGVMESVEPSEPDEPGEGEVVFLVGPDKKQFRVKKEVAMMFSMIKNLAEDVEGELTEVSLDPEKVSVPIFTDVRALLSDKNLKKKLSDSQDPGAPSPYSYYVEFIVHFMDSLASNITTQNIVDYLNAVDYLGLPDLFIHAFARKFVALKFADFKNWKIELSPIQENQRLLLKDLSELPQQLFELIVQELLVQGDRELVIDRSVIGTGEALGVLMETFNNTRSRIVYYVDDKPQTAVDALCVALQQEEQPRQEKQRGYQKAVVVACDAPNIFGYVVPKIPKNELEKLSFIEGNFKTSLIGLLRLDVLGEAQRNAIENYITYLNEFPTMNNAVDFYKRYQKLSLLSQFFGLLGTSAVREFQQAVGVYKTEIKGLLQRLKFPPLGAQVIAVPLLEW